MGFFGLGRRSSSTATAVKPAQAVQAKGPDKAGLAAAAARGDAAALDRLLAEPVVNAAQLGIVAVQDAAGPNGLRAVAALSERKVLKSVVKKAKVASVREAATARLAALEVTVAQPSIEKARAARASALEELIPRATRLAVGNGSGAQAAWEAIAAERAAILAGSDSLPLDERASATLARLDQLAGEVRQRVGEAAVRVEAEVAAAAAAAAAAEAVRIEAEGRRAAPAPEGFAAVVQRAEELAKAADPEGAVDEFLRLHKESLRFGDLLDPSHDLRVRFGAAWEAHRAARRQARADRGERREQAAAELAALLAKAEALAAAGDAIAPDDAAALTAHQQTLDALRDSFRVAARAVPPNEARISRERFLAVLDDAYAPLRAAREAADAESFTNLVHAEQLKDEIEALPVDTDPAAAFRGLRDCQARWRKLGPMPRSKARVAWDAFRAAGDTCFAKLKPWLAAQDQERQAVLARREELCVEAEAVAARPAIGLPGSPAERDGRRATGALMRGLQQRWREAGEVPRGMDRVLYERFKKAQDAYWERHKADLDAEHERLDAAAAECEQVVLAAEAFAGDAEKAMAVKSGLLTAADVQRRVRELRDRARELPLPPREARVALEARFDAAIARILTTIRGKLDSERAALEGAAAKRRALLDELDEILVGENPRWQKDAVDRIKLAWRDAGRVPAEDRDALDKRFSETMGKWRALEK
jgi:hypothetical protein